VFWDSEGVIHVDFLPHGVIINGQYYSNLLLSDVQQAIQKERPRKLSKIILLHDSAHPQKANLMKMTMAIMGWKIMNHTSYSPVLFHSDFHLFGPMKMHLGQKFQTDDEKTGSPELAMQSG
jgi:hypothetical protein